MIKEIDQRNFDTINEESKILFFEKFTKRLDASSSSEIINASNISGFTGTPEKIINNSKKEHDSIINAGLDYLQSISPVMGFTFKGEAEFIPDPYITKTYGGSQVVHYQQYYRGVPIFQMGRSVQFTNKNVIQNVTGESIYITEDISLIPQLNTKEAFKVANNYMLDNRIYEYIDSWGIKTNVDFNDTSNYEPSIIVKYSLPSEPTVLSQGPFASVIPSHLVVFFTGKAYRLGWYFVINFNQPPAQYDAIISADDKSSPEVLYFHETSKYYPKGKGKVYQFSGGIAPKRIKFPVDINDLAVEIDGRLPSGFPRDWIEKDKTLGNNTIAVLGNTSNSLKGKVVKSNIHFSPKDPNGDDQKVLNIFYFCNIMHDFFYLLGFDESAGNFQKINFNFVGPGNDPVIAKAHKGKVNGTATMRTPVDGQSPEMNMGLVEGTGRHTAFDSDVVFHEFVHGVTNRLVGGKFNSRALEMPQSGGMGEGWSDYFALTFRNYFFNTEKNVSGDWVTGNSGGVRSHAYDDNYPGTYGQIGKKPYTGVHQIGEIWCATLMYMTRKLVVNFNKHKAYNLAWQVIIDGIKLTSPNPSFLTARNSIIQAIDDLIVIGKFKSILNKSELIKAKSIFWEAFAKFGMGINASSSHSGLTGIKEDFKTP
ncbi:M36 family metallopeptidase [uncultured Psychroserpens sp.]|uniref:M36 family metallopeptidase n=1 Tax=uncultured Psychroserpens sp. TaxID=255436 RepID=UPI0026182933|nr:M36 family metallopeptidase [uncultured Psychroserpens sp.]